MCTVFSRGCVETHQAGWGPLSGLTDFGPETENHIKNSRKNLVFSENANEPLTSRSRKSGFLLAQIKFPGILGPGMAQISRNGTEDPVLVGHPPGTRHPKTKRATRAVAKVSDWDAPAPTAKPTDVTVQKGTRPDGIHSRTTPTLDLVALCNLSDKMSARRHRQLMAATRLYRPGSVVSTIA